MADINVASGQAAADQESLLKLPARFRRLAEKNAAKRARTKRAPVAFSWIAGREVLV